VSEHSSNRQSPQWHFAGFRADTSSSAEINALPSVPISLATRIRLEMLVMRSSALNLREITDAILWDPGATLQLLRVVDEEYRGDEGRPTRIEHCIALMNHERWYGTVCSSVIGSEDQHISSAWKQFRRNAQYAREAAMRIKGFCPEEAYLVGLLHQIGKLPHLLGWTKEKAYTTIDERVVGVRLAQSWSAPKYLIEAMRDQQQGSETGWNTLLRIAQQDGERHHRIEDAFHNARLATSFIC
jgi:HD-like signal output (HDOD) protein